jgi:ABC-type glycerol-3-phosphate transport system permease component
MMQNGLVTVALLSFVGAWNNFFFPLIVLSQETCTKLGDLENMDRFVALNWETQQTNCI